MNYKQGDRFSFAYPFIREDYTSMDGEGYATTQCWRPGCRMEPVYDDARAVADGIGSQILTVVGTYKPTGYPERIFYTRKWVDPDGKQFGSNKLHIRSKSAFGELKRGYRHRFERAKGQFVVGKVEHAANA